MSLRLLTAALNPLPSRRSLLPRYRLVSPAPRFSSRPTTFGPCQLALMAGTSAPTAVALRDRIVLSETEERIFNRLLDVCRHFGLTTQLRVAGGWVRDKLLGKDSHDIDIALDNILGKEFCQKVNEYSTIVGEEQHTIGIIQCNPEQSKHLETANMRVFGMMIDFVNLRSETYAENSRIPTMKFGTAEDDAYRRDLTINSLFYNINTNSVEDLTGRGVEDLRAGRIVTPLPPKETFLDDPLRVLRAVRFAARFGFQMDENLKEAASDVEVKAALGNKISRERIGHEVNLMMYDKGPTRAMSYIVDFKLFFAVFTFPENPQPPLYEECDRDSVSYISAAYALIETIGDSVLVLGFTTEANEPDGIKSYMEEQRRLLLYGALLLPIKNMIYKDRKSKEVHVTNYIIRDSLKLKANDAETVVKLHEACDKFIELLPLLVSNGDVEHVKATLDDEYFEIPLASVKRVSAGLILRQIKDFWRPALLLSTLLYPEPYHFLDDTKRQRDELDRRKDLYLQSEKEITELGLDRVWEVKLLLDGKVIMGVLQLKSGGPAIGKWQQRLVKWQLANPDGTMEDCLEWVKQSQSKRQRLDYST